MTKPSYLSDTPRPSYRADLSDGDAVKLARDDIKAFYLEAAAAQPGPSGVLDNWFWGETATGRVVLELKAVCLNKRRSGHEGAWHLYAPAKVAIEPAAKEYFLVGSNQRA